MDTDPRESPPEDPQATAPGWKHRLRPLIKWTEHCLAALGGFFLIYFICFDLSYMSTSSMSPTLQSTESAPDCVLTQKVSLWFFKPARWEIITFRDREGTQLMKRVVGLPGEAVSLPDVGKLQVDGKRLQVPEDLSFLQYLPAGNLANGKVFPTGQGWYVLGDQLRDSLDSRYEGSVPKERIVGRPWLRIWPPSRIGFIR